MSKGLEKDRKAARSKVKEAEAEEVVTAEEAEEVVSAEEVVTAEEAEEVMAAEEAEEVVAEEEMVAASPEYGSEEVTSGMAGGGRNLYYNKNMIRY